MVFGNRTGPARFELTAPAGSRVVGLIIRSGGRIDALGLYTAPMDTSAHVFQQVWSDSYRPASPSAATFGDSLWMAMCAHGDAIRIGSADLKGLNADGSLRLPAPGASLWNFDTLAANSSVSQFSWTFDADIYAGVSFGEGVSFLGMGEKMTGKFLTGCTISLDGDTESKKTNEWGISVENFFCPEPTDGFGGYERYTWRLCFLPASPQWTQELAFPKLSGIPCSPDVAAEGKQYPVCIGRKIYRNAQGPGPGFIPIETDIAVAIVENNTDTTAQDPPPAWTSSSGTPERRARARAARR